MKHLLIRRLVHHAGNQLQRWASVHRLYSQLADIRELLGRHQSGTVKLEKNASTGIAVITLNNPGRKNALSGGMMVELADHVTKLGQWKEGKGLILRGADHTFCSGGDLKTVSAIMNPEDGCRMSQFMHDTVTRLRALPLVSVALVEGMALGGGAELTLACDVRVMTESSKLGFVQVRMGVTTGWGGATQLLRLLGRSKTLQILGSGRLLLPKDALELGLVEHIIPDQPSPVETAETLLQDVYCRSSVPLVRAVKQMVVGIENSNSVTEALEVERNVFRTVWGGEVQKAALEKNIKHS